MPLLCNTTSFGSNSSFLERSQSEDNLSIGNSNSSSYCMLSQQITSSVGRMLSTCTPIAPSKLPTKRLKSCGQVLTSADYMQKMEEKEQSQNAKKYKKLRNILRKQHLVSVKWISIYILIFLGKKQAKAVAGPIQGSDSDPESELS